MSANPGRLAAPAGSHGVDNNFNLLRLVLAAAVAVYHAALLSGVPGWRPAVAPLSLGAELGVQGFFVLSGFLVYGSLERSRTLARYAEKRARRLYPAYAVVVLICAVAALAASPASRADPGAVAAYAGWNLVFLNFVAPTLPGLFEANVVGEVNGALWTLKIEVMFYIALPVLAWLLRAAGKWRWVLVGLIYAAAEGFRFALEHAGGHSPGLIAALSRQLPGQMGFFITGVAFAMVKGPVRWPLVAPLGAVLFAASLASPLGEPLRAAGWGILAIGFAAGLPRLVDAARFGDLSYGVYIIHFPILQAIAAAGLFARSPALGAATAALACLAGALLLWRLVERPALRRDSAYRKPVLA